MDHRAAAIPFPVGPGGRRGSLAARRIRRCADQEPCWCPGHSACADRASRRRSRCHRTDRAGWRTPSSPARVHPRSPTQGAERRSRPDSLATPNADRRPRRRTAVQRIHPYRPGRAVPGATDPSLRPESARAVRSRAAPPRAPPGLPHRCRVDPSQPDLTRADPTRAGPTRPARPARAWACPLPELPVRTSPSLTIPVRPPSAWTLTGPLPSN